jgi:hypothetical protein
VTGILNNLKITERWVVFRRFGGSFTTAFVRFAQQTKATTTPMAINTKLFLKKLIILSFPNPLPYQFGYPMAGNAGSAVLWYSI